MPLTEADIQFIQHKFSCTKTACIAEQLGVSESTIIRTAKKLNLSKDKIYIESLHEELMCAKKTHYLEKLKNYEITPLQKNIIAGSLLGDGSLALYGRSKNAHYREHGCDKQIGYRHWKCRQLLSLDFKMDKGGKLYSPSHPIYTEFYKMFYTDAGTKLINKENVSILDHPIGLACLYMDDGTLVIDSSGSYQKKYLFPRVSLYTLCYSEDENTLLQQHIQKVFGVTFKLKKHPDGKGYLLELNRRNSIISFLTLVEPYVSQIPCMQYKINLEQRMTDAQNRFYNTAKEIVLRFESIRNTAYLMEEEQNIITWSSQGISDMEIAKKLNRTYWGIVDKKRRLRCG